MFATLAVIAAGMLAAGLLISRAARTLHNDGLFKHRSTRPPPARPRGSANSPGAPRPDTAPRATARLRRAPRRARPAHRPTAAPVKLVRQRPGAKRSGGLLGLGGLKVVLVAALEIAAGVALIAMLGALLVLRRVRRRSRRRYELYELHLSTHDQAKPQDLEDMVESIANIIRAFPAERVRDGQPYVALELICGQSEQGTEWSVNVRCEPSSVRALDAAISATYPDVRIGRQHVRPVPPPTRGAASARMRDAVSQGRAASCTRCSPPARSSPRRRSSRSPAPRSSSASASIVRFQLTPTPSFFEELRAPRVPPPRAAARTPRAFHAAPGGLSSTLNRSEMQQRRSAPRTAACSGSRPSSPPTACEACKTVAAAVQSRRGENRLHRRIDDRPPAPVPPPVPPSRSGRCIPSMRCLVSAAEVAHLLELPTARMKGVPVRRPRSRGSPLHPDDPAGRPRPTEPAELRGRGSAQLRNRSAPEDLYPVLRAENARGRDRPRRPQVRRAADRRPGQRARAQPSSRCYLNDCQGPRRRTARDRPQVRALPAVPEVHPPGLRQAASGSWTSATPRSG